MRSTIDKKFLGKQFQQFQQTRVKRGQQTWEWVESMPLTLLSTMVRTSSTGDSRAAASCSDEKSVWIKKQRIKRHWMNC